MTRTSLFNTILPASRSRCHVRIHDSKQPASTCHRLHTVNPGRFKLSPAAGGFPLTPPAISHEHNSFSACTTSFKTCQRTLVLTTISRSCRHFSAPSRIYRRTVMPSRPWLFIAMTAIPLVRRVYHQPVKAVDSQSLLENRFVKIVWS